MTGLVKRLLISSHDDGLHVRSVGHRSAGTSARIDYGTNRVGRGSMKNLDDGAQLEVHGIVGRRHALRW